MLYLTVILPLIAYLLPIEDKRVKFVISIAPAIYVILFRFGLGTDYFSYEFLYNNHDISNFYNTIRSQSKSMEMVFRLLIYIFKLLKFPFQYFVAFLSLIIYSFFIKWLSDTQENLSLSIMLFNGMFFVVWTLGALRQGLVLAIGTYLFFNKKFKVKGWQSVIIILLLGQIHASAYIYFLILIFDMFNLNKKKLIFIIIFSLISTLIPYNRFLLQFDSIRIVGKFLTYVTGNSGFWDSSGLLRLVFVIFIFVFYNDLTKKDYLKKLTDSSLLGFSLYYLLKVSEITAARIQIFSFVLIVPLFVYMVEQLPTKKIITVFSIISLFTFSMMYMEKNLIATQRESGKKEVDLIYKFKSYNKLNYNDYYSYDNQYSVLAYNRGLCFKMKNIQYPITYPIKHEGLIVVKGASGSFGLINERGIWEILPVYKDKPELYGGTLVFKKSNPADGEFYFNLDGEFIEEPSPTMHAERHRSKLLKEVVPKKTSTSFFKYENNLEIFFPNLNQIEEVNILEYDEPFLYKTLVVKYWGNNYYFFLDDELNIHNGTVFGNEIRFDQNNMSLATTFCGNVVLNSKGDIIYRERE